MAYNKKNYLRKRQRAAEVTSLYYEPGRQDRCHRWVWAKYIHDTFHVEYPTYMRWLREERKLTTQDAQQQTLFD